MSVLSIHHKPVDTVVFDFDGTLALLNIDFNRMRIAIHELVSSYGIDYKILGHTFVLEMIGEVETLLQKNAGDASKSFVTNACRMIEEIEVEAAQQGKLFSGTKDLLTKLQQHFIRVGIITRNCSKAVFTVFPDILSYCPVVICRDDVVHVKPHPEQLKLALTRLDSAAARSIMIGDHPLDIETGHNAGTLTAGVLTGHFQKEDFTRNRASIVLFEASEILKYLSPVNPD